MGHLQWGESVSGFHNGEVDNLSLFANLSNPLVIFPGSTADLGRAVSSVL